MEDRLKKLKSEMLADELADFEFTEKMRDGVMRKIDGRTPAGRKKMHRFQRFVPIGLSIAFFSIFAAGIYWLVFTDNNMNPGQETPPEQTVPDKEKEPKPELVFPTYVPAPYVFKHTRTDGELYQHIYVNPEAEGDSFSYGMRKGKGTGGTGDLQLAADLTGQYAAVDQATSYVSWEEEGYIHTVEQKGEMSKLELLKIVDSILTAKGYDSLLAGEIEKLEAEQEVAEEPPGKEEPAEETPANEEPADDTPAKVEGTVPEWTADDAIALLSQYKKITVNPEYESDSMKFRTIATKDEYYEQFAGVMTKEAAAKVFDHRIKEEEDGLYTVPTEYPLFFSTSDPYEFSKTGKEQYTLTQKNTSELYSPAVLRVVFSWDGQRWIITDLSW
ncbi:hypothetical protein [Bacillus sp. REN3]|uniref:hypothetical protein n=1 Tax=Bacillus sp. REN3 TaxID=2802440 RepID=UPI001AEE5B18|nr:hypothetical protein [Bacillus sp. REN3]